MKKIIEIIITLTLLLATNVFADKYCKDIHKYLFEEGVNLLENYKVYEEYQEYNAGVENPRYNKMKEGSWKEDEADWVYGYAESDGPSIYVTGVDDLSEVIMELFMKSITHFWDADNFVIHQTSGHNIVSGYLYNQEYIVHDIPSAVTKTYTTLFGYNHEIHYKRVNYTSWGDYQQFQLVNGGTVTLWSLGKVYKVSIESIDDYINNHNVYIVAHYNIQGQLVNYDPPYYVHMGDAMWGHFTSQNPDWEYSYLGRIIHLIGDMAVPAHVHNDNHAPNFDLGGWDTSACDEYEGWDDTYDPFIGTLMYPAGGYLGNNVDLIEMWDAETTLQEYGGLIDVPSDYEDEDFLFDLFYSINQVTDMFASDDLDGDCNAHPDHPFSEYPFIQEMQDKFENEVLPNFPNIQNSHEITDTGEREAIRDFCIPSAIRGIATFLEWYAQINNFTPIAVYYRPVAGHVALDGGSGNITDVSITFDKQGSGEDFTIHPNANGNFSTTLFTDQFGTYDIIYSLGNYLTVTLNNIQIEGGEDILQLPNVMLSQSGCIAGHVTLSGGGDNARPVTDVTIKAGDYSTNPDENGDYVLQVTIGTYDVKAFLPAYSFGIENDIVIEAGTTTTVDFTLHYTGYIFVSQDEDWHFTTIQDGIDAALDGEIVLVDDGIYYESGLSWFTWDFWTKHITVRSIHGPENCIIDVGGGTHGFFFEEDYTYSSSDVIDGFTIRNAEGSGIWIGNGSPTIRNNIIRECGYEYSYNDPHYLLGGGIHCKGSGTITGNIIEDNINACCGGEPDEVSYGGGIYIETEETDTVKVIGNTIRGNAAFEGGGIYATGTGEVVIDNNEITENSYADPGYPWIGYGAGITCQNCTSVKINYNLIHHNIEGPYGANNVVYINTYYPGPLDADVEITNNTIANNNNMNAVTLSLRTGNICTLTNNIIAYNHYGIYRYFGPHPIITYCNVWGNEEDYHGTNPGENCISEDPHFFDPANGNYSLIWNEDTFSPCIDTGDPDTDWDTDNTPPDMGAIPAISHDYFYNQYDGGVIDHIEWISFPALNRITTGYTEALGLLQRQELIDDDQYSTDDILDHVVFEDEEQIYFYNESWINELQPDGYLHSYQGYKIVLQEGYTSADIGISGTWEDESEPIQLYANKANWVGCYLEEPATLRDAFDSIWDEWISIKSEHWAIFREWEEEEIRGTVNPGELYIITVENDCELIWNESSPPVPPYRKEMTDYFSYEEKLDYMPILVDTVYGDTAVAELGVYYEDECIGASKVTDGYPVQILAYTPESGSKDGGNGLEFMLYYGSSKNKAKVVTNYTVFNRETSAFVSKPVYYDRDDFVRVRLNTEGHQPEYEFALMNNYPNPVHNGLTNISFALPKDDKNAEIQIFNIKGQLVKSVDCNGIVDSGNGQYTITWDCHDNNGKEVSNGIYFYKLTSDNKTAVKKMLVIH